MIISPRFKQKSFLYSFWQAYLLGTIDHPDVVIVMDSSSNPTQPSDREVGSVLCDNCKKSVLEPDQNASDLGFPDRLRQIAREWRLSPSMWPVGYLIESSYSPFHVEQELLKRDWRNAFEDLLALESGGEMISQESREEEKAVAASLRWERAAFCIGRLNQLNQRESAGMALAQRFRSVAEQRGHHKHLSWIDGKLGEIRAVVGLRVALAQEFKASEEARREWSASRHKDRCQWMASLITSGALPGWRSKVEDSTDGVYYSLGRVDGATPEDNDTIRVTELELHELFDRGKPLEWSSPGPPLYHVASRNSPQMTGDGIEYYDDGTALAPSDEPPPDEPVLMSETPDHPCFRAQLTSAERITLPNGKVATKVTVKNVLTNDEVEEKVMVQEPGNVLREVEKVRALIQDRIFGFDQPV